MPISPQASAVHTKIDTDTKKTWEFVSSLIPVFRPSHCPFVKISNASQPTPSNIISLPTNAIIKFYYSSKWLEYNTPHVDASVALPLWYGFKVAKFEKPQIVTFENVLSETSLTNDIASFHQCLDPPCPLRTGLVSGKIKKYFWKNKFFCCYFGWLYFSVSPFWYNRLKN